MSSSSSSSVSTKPKKRYPNWSYLNVYKFERIRLGTKTRTINGEEYGPYLYRNIEKPTQLMSSWIKPYRGLEVLYKGEEIGTDTDAIIYYKNN